MIRFIKNVVVPNLILVLLIAAGCTNKASEKKADLQSTVASNDQMLAMTPPMGWNSWNPFGENVSERVIKETADAKIK